MSKRASLLKWIVIMPNLKSNSIRTSKSRIERFGLKKWDRLSLREQVKLSIWRTMLLEHRNAENYYKGED